MGRLFGLLLIVLGIYLGITVYEKGVDAVFGGVFAGSRASAPPALDSDGAGAPAPTARRPGTVSPSAITQRVRQRVTEDIQQGARRHSGE
jgi:hypothetical protein